MMHETFQTIAEEVKSLVEERLGSAKEDIKRQLDQALLLESQIEELEKAISETQLDSSIGLTSIRVVADELAKRIEELESIEIYQPVDGKDGKDGADGKDGIDGKDGESIVGPAGADGIDGNDGVGIDVPIWTDGVYREGALVQAHHGQYFKALRDTASNVDSEDWERVGTAGFRMTGAFDDERKYEIGDLFIKDFGLFLSNGEEHKVVAGRGPQGKKGEKGLPGKDGLDGADGKDGKDGDNFDCIELNGTNLVVVMKSADGEVVTKTVDLSPVLDVAAEVTKSIETKTQDKLIDAWNEQAKNFTERLQQHLLDQEAIPVGFYRGLWASGQSYIRGDLVTYGGALYVSRVTTESTPKSVFEVGGDWVQISSGATAVAVAGVDDGSGSGGGGTLPILPAYALITESGTGGTKFTSFQTANNADPISGVGLQNGKNVKFELTTDAVAVNPNPFRNAKNGQFIGTPEELANLKNQRDVNEFFYNAISDIETGDINLDGYVSKTGGDDMEGPLNVKNQPDTGSRDTNRVHTLGVYSNSGSSYLGLGTTSTKVYVGQDDTSFTTPIKVSAIEQRDGWGIEVTGGLYVDNGDDSALYLMKDGRSYMELSASGSVSLYNGYTEFKDNELVPKEYVDGRVDEVASALPSDAPQPVDIGTQTLKITGSRPTGAAGEAGKMLCWKAQAGGPGSPFNEIKFIIPDTSVIDTNSNQMWLKQGDIVQRWETAGAGWFTNGNVLHVSGNVTEGDDLIDGQPVEMYYSDPSSPYLEAISKEESKADDRKLQAEIEELALGLETLLTQRTHGQWKYIGFSGDNIPRNAGEFALVSDDLSAQDNMITINLTDLNGLTIGLSDVKAGDYIEIVDLDEPANYVLFTCTKAPEGTGISNIEVALKDKGNNFLVGDTCEIRFFAINQESIELSELDSRYLKLSGGAMAANARINVDQIEPNDPLGYIRYEAGRDKRYPFALANCGMVKEVAVEEATPLIEEAITALDDKFATKEYVDGKTGSPIFGRRFKYSTSSRPDDGHFYVAADVAFSFADLDGLVLKHTESPDFGWNSRIKMTVWNMEGELWYAMELRGASNYSSTHLKFYKEETRFDKGLVVGEEYRIKIEGYW